MKTNFNLTLLLIFGLILSSSFSISAQCPSGELEVTIVVNTDAYGYETYWELTPAGDPCGTNTIATGGNLTMNCTSGGAQVQEGSGYSDNAAVSEGPYCLTEGAMYTIHWVDDWGDGTAGFDVLVGGVIISSFPITTGGGNGTYDFTVMQAAQFDASAASAAPLHAQYTALPVTETGITLNTGTTVDNLGTQAITNVTVDVSVSDGVSIVHTETLGPLASIPAGGNMTLTGTGFIPSNAGTYTATYTVNIAETDEDPSNNITSTTFDFNLSQARDNGIFSGNLGIGAGTEGQLGQEFTLANPGVITGATFVLGAPTAGDVVTVDLFDFVGAPTTILASSSSYTVDNANDGLPVQVTFPCPIVVQGDYALVLNEPSANNVTLSYSNSVYVPNKTWINFPGNPNNAWANAEAFNFLNVVFMLRADFGTMAPTPLQATLSGTTLTANVTASNYQWLDCDNNNAVISGATSQDFTPTQTGNYAVRVTENGCTSMSICYFVCISSDTPVTQNGSTLTADQTGATYQWLDCDNNNAIISGATNQNFTPSQAGNYAVEVSINGCVATSTCYYVCMLPNLTVTQNGNTLMADQAGASYQWLDCDNNNAIVPGAINQSFSPTLSGSYAVEITMNGCTEISECSLVCPPVTVSTSTGSGSNFIEVTPISGASYQWIDCDNNNAIVPGETNVIFTASESGLYGVEVNINGCIEYSACHLICIPLTIEITETDNMLEASPVSGASYQWLDCDNNNAIIPGATSPIFTATETGNYALEIDDLNCISTSSCYSVVVIGLDKNDLTEKITVFPNPTNGKFSVNLGETHAWVEAKIINVTGQEIQTEIFTNAEDLNLEIKGAAGFYFLEITTANNKKAIIKIVKE